MYAISQPGYKWVIIFEAFLSFSYQGFQVMSFLFYYTALSWSLNASIAMVHVSNAIFSVAAILSIFVLQGHEQLSANAGAVVATMGHALLLATVLVAVLAPYWDRLDGFMTSGAVLGHVLLCAGAGWTRQAYIHLAVIELAAQSDDPQRTRTSFLTALLGASAVGLALAAVALPALRMNLICDKDAVCWPAALVVAVGGLIIGLVPFNVVTRAYWWTRSRANTLKETILLIGTCAVVRDDGVYVLRIRRAFRVAVLFAPLTIFWAVHDQMYTRFIHQGLVMDGFLDDVTSVEPDAMFFVFALTTMLALPVLRSIIYPLLGKVSWCRLPKLRIVVGAALASLAFFLAFEVESHVQDELESLPSRPPKTGDIALWNPTECTYTASLSGLTEGIQRAVIAPNNVTVLKNLAVKDRLKFSLDELRGAGVTPCDKVVSSSTTRLHLVADVTTHYLLGVYTVINTRRLYAVRLRYPASNAIALHDVNRSRLQVPRVGFVYHVFVNRSFELPTCANLEMFNDARYARTTTHLYANKNSKNFVPVPAGRHRVTVCQQQLTPDEGIALRKGGIYVYMALGKHDGWTGHLVVLQTPFTVALTTQIPQYLLMALAHLLCPALLLEYTITQVHQSMLPLLLLTWLSAHALGNVLVALEVTSGVLTTRRTAFLIYGCLMTVATLALGVLLWLHRDASASASSSSSSSSTSSSSSSANGEPEAERRQEPEDELEQESEDEEF